MSYHSVWPSNVVVKCDFGLENLWTIGHDFFRFSEKIQDRRLTINRKLARRRLMRVNDQIDIKERGIVQLSSTPHCHCARVVAAASSWTSFIQRLHRLSNSLSFHKTERW
jgi:hypothetical protein